MYLSTITLVGALLGLSNALSSSLKQVTAFNSGPTAAGMVRILKLYSILTNTNKVCLHPNWTYNASTNYRSNPLLYRNSKCLLWFNPIRKFGRHAQIYCHLPKFSFFGRMLGCGIDSITYSQRWRRQSHHCQHGKIRYRQLRRRCQQSLRYGFKLWSHDDQRPCGCLPRRLQGWICLLRCSRWLLLRCRRSRWPGYSRMEQSVCSGHAH